MPEKSSEYQPEYKLTYFDAKGSAETIRLILAYKEVEYEDIRIPIGTLTAEKKKVMRVTNLPTLQVDDEVFTQYTSIARYLAIKYGLAGETDLESLRIEECIYTMDEYFRKWIPIFHCNCEETKNEARKKIYKIYNGKYMGYYDNLLKKNMEAGNDWFVGNKMSWADIDFANCTSNFIDCLMKKDLLEDYPRLQELRARVLDEPRIKEYTKNRRETTF